MRILGFYICKNIIYDLHKKVDAILEHLAETSILEWRFIAFHVWTVRHIVIEAR